MSPTTAGTCTFRRASSSAGRTAKHTPGEGQRKEVSVLAVVNAPTRIGRSSREIHRVAGEEGLRSWRAIEAELKPLGEAAALLPATALRFDPWIALTTARFGPALLQTARYAATITGPFSRIVDRHARSGSFVQRLMDLESFVLSGVPARDTITAEMAFILSERNSGRSTIDFPLGGTASVVQALVRGLEKNGGRLLLRSHVEEVVIEGGKAVGVRLRGEAQGYFKGSVRPAGRPSSSFPSPTWRRWRGDPG